MSFFRCDPSQILFRRSAIFSLIFAAMVFGQSGVPLATRSLPAHDDVFQPGLVKGKQSRDYQGKVASSTSNDNSQSAIGISTISGLLRQIRVIHPIVIAIAQVFVVVGVCLLLTDNRELELYFKIEFRPPKTDILN